MFHKAGGLGFSVKAALCESMINKVTRYVLPALIVICCVPSAALGVFAIAAIFASHT
jgi:uncharacterized protein YybS (DUF2232 family)